MSSGPVDRYTQTRKRAKRLADNARDEADAQQAADADAADGRYSCAWCFRTFGLAAFTYTHEGVEKVARRCAECRAINRANNYRRGLGRRKP